MNKLLQKMSMMSLLVFFSCSSQTSIKLGNKMNENSQSTSRILILSGALVNAVTSQHNSNSFTIGVNDNKTVVYISTIDPNFEIKGFKINDDISKIFESSKVHYIIGWGYYIKIDSDWYAGFDISSKPNKNSKIQWFFKYKFSEGSRNLFIK